MALPKTNSFYLNLISGVYDATSANYGGTTLETYLTANAQNLAIFSDMLGDRQLAGVVFSLETAFKSILASATGWAAVLASDVALSVIAASGWATARLCQEGQRLAGIFDYTAPTRINHWLNNAFNRANLAAMVNAAGSKLKRQVFTGNGTWTKPTTLYAISLLLIGGGGGGGRPAASSGAGGGGGGQILSYILTTLPTGNGTVTIGTSGAGRISSAGAGTAGGNTSFAASSISTLTANGGTGGASGAGGAGGTGGTAGDSSNYLAITDLDFENAIFQCRRVSLVGGVGGAGAPSSNTSGLDGGDCLPNTGGAGGGIISGSLSDGGSGGRKYSGGGGGGAYSSAGTAAVGYSSIATSYGAGGGGGATNGSSSQNGGNGAVGLCVVYWVEG